MSSFESTYKVFKASWGILIVFKGEFIENPESSILDNAIRIKPNVFFELKIDPNNQFLQQNKYLFESGIRWVQNVFPDDKIILIKLDKLELAFCDFQLEGLHFGIAHWICSYFNVPLPEHYIEYGSSIRKYKFYTGKLKKLFEISQEG